MLCAEQMADERQEELFCSVESAFWRNAGPSAYELRKNVLKRNNFCSNMLLFNYVILRTF